MFLHLHSEVSDVGTLLNAMSQHRLYDVERAMKPWIRCLFVCFTGM